MSAASHGAASGVHHEADQEPAREDSEDSEASEASQTVSPGPGHEAVEGLKVKHYDRDSLPSMFDRKVFTKA